jgi:formylglycine-generating enzyme required for sulfatase activity
MGYTVAASHHAEPLEETMTTPQVFVSHNHLDNDYCRAFVEALRQALGDTHDAVWYDEHNLGWGTLQQVIDQELLKRQHFIAILSPNAVASDWVKTEIYAALELLRKGRVRTFQLVLAVPCDVSAVSPTLGGYKRIEQPGEAPFPPAAAAMRAYRVILDVHGGDPPPPPPPRETLPALGPAPAPANGTSALHLTPKPYYDLGFRGYSVNGVECILPPLCPVPAGVFTMGSDKTRDKEASDDETPQYLVDVDAFAIGQHPVTVAEYACAVRAKAVCEPPQNEAFGTKYGPDWKTQQAHLDHPVVNVSWNDAVAYCAWLTKTTGQRWRLPSEAKWEKAARGADGRIYPWGDTFDKARCNTDASGIGTPMPVGRYPNGASPYQVQDMAGNVWEWTSSLYQPYPYRKNDGRENLDSTESRVLRGGSWNNNARNTRPACRIRVHPVDLVNYWGFRLACAAADS